MSNTFQFTTYDTIKTFFIIVVSIGVSTAIFLCIFSYPFKILVKTIHKYPKHDLEKYYFYYQKAAAYRLLFITHLIFSKIMKILSAASTFVTVYCAIDDNDFILLFSLIAAMCEVISLTMPTETYSKMHVQAARKLEYVLNNGDNLQDQDFAQMLNTAYQEAEKIIEENFE